MRAGQLNADWFELPAVQGAVNYVTRQARAATAPRSAQCAGRSLWHANFAGPAEVSALRGLRFWRVRRPRGFRRSLACDARRLVCLDGRPCSGKKVVGTDRWRRCETPTTECELEPSGRPARFPTYFPRGNASLKLPGNSATCRPPRVFIKVSNGKSSGRNRFGRVTPEGQRVSLQARIAVAKVQDVDAGFPAAPGLRLPFQAKRVWRRDENLCVHRELPVPVHQNAGRGGAGTAIKISIRGQAVIEICVEIVVVGANSDAG